jgi:hypothetical protein
MRLSRRVLGGAAVTTVAAIALILVGSIAPASAAGDPRSASPGEILTFRLPYLEHVVTDPNAQELAQHAAKPGPLLLFLPATGEVPNNYRDFLSTAVAQGFSVLGLDYWNTGRSVTRTCGSDAECYTKLQQNRFDGKDPSRFSRVGVANSIMTRFAAAIEYLEQYDPSGHWGRYLSGSSPHWSRIVLAGHSQGGGESAFISHFHRVKGVLMFSSPVETYQDVSASWINTAGRTPVSRMYGFDDTADIYYNRIVDSWQRLGMGTADPATATDVPTGGHVLLSSLYLGTPLESHGRSVNDGTVRNGDDLPTFEPTWTWMLEQVR